MGKQRGNGVAPRALANDLKSGNAHALLTRYSDLLLAAVVIGIIRDAAGPLPPLLLGILLTINISIAVTILMVTIYVQKEEGRRPASPASRPSSSSPPSSPRLERVDHAPGARQGGTPARWWRRSGSFVTAGNLVVGFVIFLILTVIQFIVITKGAERVAEMWRRASPWTRCRASRCRSTPTFGRVR
ncbi:MAG: FHIPEP family type III secretion protein [Candidatus Eisenbacteria bacterium]